MLNGIRSPLDGIRSPFGSLRDSLARVIALLFSSNEPGFLFLADPATCFTDTARTTNATVGQAVAGMTDLSGRGNHATQDTIANRPILGRKPVGGRRNLLTFTEQFDNAAWIKSGATVTANQATNPLGSVTDADKVDATGASSGVYITSSGNVLSGVDVTLSVWVKSATGSNQTIRLRGQTGAGSNVFSTNITATSDWQRVSFTWTPSSTFPPTPGILTDASGTAFSVFLWGAQLELGSTATPYQRVGSQFDVTEAGKPNRHYLFFGGSADPRWMQTPTITPGTDLAQVFAGIRKLSDAARGTVVELTASAATNNGALHLTAPNAASATFGFESKGTTLQDAVASGFTAPVSAVLTGLGNISGDSAILRVNGTVADTETGDQGTGNYTAAAAFIGRRNGTDNAINGEISALTARFGPNLTTAQIEQVERFTASKVAETTI
jgi:hypothetical protein